MIFQPDYREGNPDSPLFDRDLDFLITSGILGAECTDFAQILEKIGRIFQGGQKIHLSIAHDSSWSYS